MKDPTQILAENIFQNKSKECCISKLSKKSVETFLNDSLDFIFPGMVRKSFHKSEDLFADLQMHLLDLTRLLLTVEIDDDKAQKIVIEYSEKIISMADLIKKDAVALLSGDPAAENLSEVLLCYPGLFAIAAYRVAQLFSLKNVPIIPRVMSELAHEKTGIDIHPKAIIGESFFIDHGTGVVIGETAVIGNNVKIYQGVTLGALSVDKSLAQTKRHPTIQDFCVIYSHATILGGETVIGEHSIIGGNVWMTKSVPPHSMVYHKSEVKLDQLKKSVKNINEQEELSYDI